MCIYMYRGLPPWPLAGPAYFLGLVFWRRTWTPDERLYSLEEASGSVSGCFWSDASATQLLAYWPRHGGSGDHKHPTSKTPSVSMLKFHFGTITDDMQDKYCGNCYDIYLIQSQCKGNHTRVGAAEGRNLCILALNKLNIEAVSTKLVLHVVNGPKMNLQERETGCLGSRVFVIPRVYLQNMHYNHGR